MKLVIAEKPSVATIQNASIKYIKRDRQIKCAFYFFFFVGETE